MKKFSPSKGYYIKLGQKGKWTETCINESKLMLGFHNPYHEESLQGKWDIVKKHWLDKGKAKNKATEITHQIKIFYESDENVLWITFHNRKMYWCFSKREITELPDDGHRVRPVIGQWRCNDINDNLLSVDTLSSRLTKVQAFRGTICSIKELEYLTRRINGEMLPEVKKASEEFELFKKSLIPLIKNLTWQDFELLVDLIFTHSGYKRVDTRGGPRKTIDLDLLFPVTRKRAFVQVKSQASLNDFHEYYSKYKSMEHYEEMFFVVHTANKSLREYIGPGKNNIVHIETIAELAINSGLADWIIQKSR